MRWCAREQQIRAEEGVGRVNRIWGARSETYAEFGTVTRWALGAVVGPFDHVPFLFMGHFRSLRMNTIAPELQESALAAKENEGPKVSSLGSRVDILG